MIQLVRTLCNAEELRKQVDTIRQLFLLNVSDEAEQELVTEQIKSIVKKLQQIQGDSGVRATLLLAKSSGIISNFQNLSVLSDFYAGDVPDQVTLRLEERRHCDRQAFPLAHKRGERNGRALFKLLFVSIMQVFCSVLFV